MSALVLDGKALSKLAEEDLKPRVTALETRTGRKPILATILVGEDPASATYVTMKGNACKRVGIECRKPDLTSPLSVRRAQRVHHVPAIALPRPRPYRRDFALPY